MAKIEFKRPVMLRLIQQTCGLAPGREIIVKGKANFYQQRRFSINLGVEPQYHENIALHVGPNMEMNAIFLSTRMGNWAPSQTVPNPISFTERFEFRIKLEQNHFRISLNDRHIGDIQYQFPPHMVNHIDVEGGCELKYITIEGYPQMQPNYPPPSYAAPVPVTPMYQAPTYVQQPQPVYVQQPYVQTVVTQPQVVVVEEHRHRGGLVAGALMGAAIANSRRRRFF